MLLKRAWIVGVAIAALLPAPPPAAAAANYAVIFEGAPNGLRDELSKVSSLARGERDFPTTTALAVMARRDLKSLDEALKAAGYYAGKVTSQVIEPENGGKPQVVFTVDTGPRFKITQYSIVYADVQAEGRPLRLDELKVAGDGAADGASLEKTQQAFLRALWDEGYPAARIVGRRAEAKFSAGEATAVFEFESGPKAKFGELKIEGATHTSPLYLEKLKTWEEGASFERSKLVSYRDKLSKTGIFRSIDVTPGAPDIDEKAPVFLTVEERRRRTIGAGVSYSTSEGPGGRLFFQYRNAFHRGETANVELKGTEIEQSLEFTFNKPLPNFPGSAFSELTFTNETTDAYDARTVALSGGLARKWLNDRLETRGGLAFESSKITTDTTEERTYLVSAPLSATWNTEDSLLDPRKGERVSFSLTPYTGSDTFTVAQFDARTRFNFGEDDRFTAAFRTKLGATLGTSLSGLASNKRFYAGGGGSVRGYDYQAIGPLDADGEPTGGRSLIEGAFEARARVTKNIQLAAFADAGSVSTTSLPDFSGDFFVGVGGGVRYLTPIGPIRVDVATPLERRESDRSFQLYISLGQPF